MQGNGDGDDDDVEALVEVRDLESSLQDFLASKTPPVTNPSHTQLPAPDSSPGGDLMPAVETAVEVATARKAAPPTVRPKAGFNLPGVELTKGDEVTNAETPGSFGNLPLGFLQDVQAALEGLGFDLTSADSMQALANDGNITAKLLPLLTANGTSPEVLKEQIRQWQQAIQEQIEQEQKLKAKGQRPVWICAVCGRYGCPVAPYIERYEEVDL